MIIYCLILLDNTEIFMHILYCNRLQFVTCIIIILYLKLYTYAMQLSAMVAEVVSGFFGCSSELYKWLGLQFSPMCTAPLVYIIRLGRAQ